MNLEWPFYLTSLAADAILFLVVAAAMIAGMALYRLMPSQPNQMPS